MSDTRFGPDRIEAIMDRLDKQIEENQVLQREMYQLLRTTAALRETTQASLTLVAAMYEMMKDSTPEYNFGLGSSRQKYVA